jgi:hypothetical protein
MKLKIVIFKNKQNRSVCSATALLFVYAFSISAHAQQEGSGTSWLPEAAPMYAVHRQDGIWESMLHWNLFAQHLSEPEPRGQSQFSSINWIMAMARRPIGRGRFGVNAMLSLEQWTVGGCGYPVLLATGETCNGTPIVDLQHPHDLFMELSAVWEGPLTDALSIRLYGGPSGEPALGPVAFPHRVSAMVNPIAPISHHWLDATHISFGVATAALYGDTWKLEGSLFNGREPDDDRSDLDFDALDSMSGRFWLLPTDNWALQVSAGHLKEAEARHDLTDRVNVNRVTASATYHRPLGAVGSIWASTIAWGSNEEEGKVSSFVLAETSLLLDDRDAWFGRIDVGNKSAHDLDLHDVNGMFTVGRMQAGYVRYFGSWNRMLPGIGASLTASAVPDDLDPVYGGRILTGFDVFLTLRPTAMMGMGDDTHMGHTP